MSGVAAIRYLLANNVPLIAVVPATRIKAGDLPLNIVLPAISITQVSSIPRNTVAMNPSKVQHLDRVQVSVLFKTQQAGPAGEGYPALTAALKLVLAACPNTRGTVSGIDVNSIIPDLEGPDLSNDALGIVAKSRDFFVRWNAA